MKKNSYTIQDKIENNKYLKLIIFMPIVLMLALVPLVMRLNVIQLDPSVSKYWKTDVQLDIFCYSKTVAIMIIAVFMLINLFFFWNKNYIKLDKTEKIMFGAVGVFIFSLIMSTILSDHKLIAVWGAPERYEGMVIHLCYMITFVYSYLMFKNYDGLKYFKYTILFLASVMGIIGISQIIGKDIVNSKFMFDLMTPAEYKGMFQRTVTDGQIYLTLMNSNYVGTYAALIIPFLLMFCISKYEHKYLRIYSGILALITFFILVKSGSKAGLFAVICILLLLPIIFYKVILNVKKITIFITIAVILFTGIGVNIATGNKIAENLGKIMNDAKAVLVKDKDYVHDSTYGAPIYDVKLDGNRASVYTRAGILNIDFKEDGELEFRDEFEKLVRVNYNIDKKIYFIDEFEVGVRLIKDKDGTFFSIGLWGEPAYLIEFNKLGKLYFIDAKMIRYKVESVPYIGFKNKETVLSGRGYIWSRSLPLILEKPIFGYGSDTFLVNFPQHDIEGKIKAYGKTNIITDKSHNMYLLYAINNGLIGLFSILILWFSYIAISIKTDLFKYKYNLFNLYRLACILSVIGYMLTGMLNDSVPVTAPIFWTILGVGFVLNKMVGKNYEG